MDDLSRMIDGYLREATGLVREMASSNRGGRVLGGVPGRTEEEDQEIEIDRACDMLLDQWCRDTSLDIEVHSEHGVRRPLDRPGPPKYLAAVDPFDGSGLFKRGIPAEWWTVLSVFDASRLEPVAAGAADHLRGEVYLAGPDGSNLYRESRKPVPTRVSAMRSLAESPVIAAYLMNPSYLVGWTTGAKRLIDALLNRYPSVRIWPNGGSCVYPWLARGTVQAYVMFDEPRAEIDPGLAFSWLSGFKVYSAGGGELAPYRFDPTSIGEREPLLIAACTDDLAREIAGLVQ